MDKISDRIFLGEGPTYRVRMRENGLVVHETIRKDGQRVHGASVRPSGGEPSLPAGGNGQRLDQKVRM